ncbi:Short-chain dehydrogenase/reductase SDR [Macrophomina phaseolina MS6]|uniref:Short-chain dehydrogenase/reductase SDR n=1 Tax=Macrophomina phaseolina (strain MS6) TaxID=1126212 RepID=K2QVI1_MACPH|nr:Short-chain dehydrogenase/reductase SDR [Macrophomina phaseolina MS6]
MDLTGPQVSITFVSPSSETRADEVISKVASLKNDSHAVKIQADMRDLRAPQRAVAETIAAFGNSIDILVNNAGVAHAAPLGEVTSDDFADLVDVNVRSVVFTAQAELPYLRSPSRIISLSSALSRIGQPAANVYAATNAAVEAFARLGRRAGPRRPHL